MINYLALASAKLAWAVAKPVLEGVWEELNESSPVVAAKVEDTGKSIAILGRSSVGKSSLCNALTETKSFAVGVEHGTTTKVKKAALTAGWEIVDTPGLLDQESYWNDCLKSAEVSELIIYVTKGQLYRKEVDFLDVISKQKIIAKNSAGDYIYKNKEILIFVNHEDIKRNSQSVAERKKEISYLRDQVGFMDASNIVSGSASPTNGETPDLMQLKKKLTALIPELGKDPRSEVKESSKEDLTTAFHF